MASLSPLAGLKTTGLEDDEIHCENFFKDDPTTLQKLNNVRSTMVDKITYHKLFFEKNEAIIQAVLKRRLRTYFGGLDESEASKWNRAGNRFGSGGPDQSDKPKQHIAENIFGFGGPDNIKTK